MSSFDIGSTDRVIIRGEEHRFVGHSADGYIFRSEGKDAGARAGTHLSNAEMEGLYSSGRLRIDTEYFKKRRRK